MCSIAGNHYAHTFIMVKLVNEEHYRPVADQAAAFVSGIRDCYLRKHRSASSANHRGPYLNAIFAVPSMATNVRRASPKRPAG